MIPKFIRKLYYRIVPTYRRLEIRFVSYAEGDRLIKSSALEEDKTRHWHLAFPEEDTNHVFNRVYLERKERVFI